MRYYSEGESLPAIGQNVLLLTPRQSGEFWDAEVACILAKHEDVRARPVKPGSEWPTEYYWGRPYGGELVCLVTGNGFWAYLDGLNLPPGAEHRIEHGCHFIAQPKPVFVPQKPF